ncbi:MAG: hypothetical protein ABI632_09295 [Pseudolysinimonas sp.]
MKRALLAVVALLSLAGCASPAPPAPLSQAQVDAITAADNDARWSFFFGERPDVARPHVTRLGYLDPHSAESFYKKCLVDAGVNPDDIFGFGIYDVDPTGLTEAYLTYYVCVAEYPVNPIAIGYLSTPQLGFMYDYYSTRLAPCLLALGYSVEPAPRRAAFVDGSFNGSGWDPYADVHPTPGKHSWDFIDERCPPLPVAVYGHRHP